VEHPSLKDVAARAGVSFQTAGKALSGKGRVSRATRQRVVDAADGLGYVPNAIARSLISRSTGTIGVIATEFSDTTLAQHIVGIEREARRQGLCVIIGSLDRSGSDCEQYLRLLLERRVDGILMVAPIIESNQRIGELLRGTVPTVSLHGVAGGGVSTVMADDIQSALLPVRHLLALGHVRIGTITGWRGRQVAQARVAGYKQALAEAGLDYDEALVEEGDWEVSGGYSATHRLLDRVPDVTAIYVQNDMMGVGVLSALHHRGRRVPEDCAVAACDDLPIASRTIPPLTTVRIPFVEIGEAAARLLVEQLAGGSQKPAEVVLPVHLQYRASSRAAESDEPQQTIEE
jgi:DNA-binding LacI/PurR family transcriptional regulator